MTFFGEFPPNLRMQYSDQYNLTIKRQLPGDILFQIGYVGSQGHRLLASYEANPGNPTTCNDLQNISNLTGDTSLACGAFGEDSAYTIGAGEIPVGVTLHLPYGGVPTVTGPNPTPITLVGLRKYSSPLCQPTTGVGCPADGTPVFSGIFSENTVAKSNYNSLQVLFQKNFSHGLQFQASYTLSKTMDNASSFESALNPLNFDATYGLSAYDARNRFVFNYVWDLPIPKFDGFKGKLLDGWEMSGILSFQTGFPIRITSQDDVEELDSTDLFEFPGEPNLTAPFHTQNIRQNNGFAFDPNLFTNSTVAAWHDRQCAAFDVLRTGHQQLGHELHEGNQLWRTSPDGIPDRHFQHLESRAVLQRGRRHIGSGQHVRPGPARTRSAADPVLAEVPFLRQ